MNDPQFWRKMHDVIRDGNEQRERDKAETQRATELERDSSFFDVQWSLFKDKPALPLKTLLPLSVGLNPSHRCAKIEWAQKYGDKSIGKAAESLAEMLRRHGVLIDYLDIEHPEMPVVKKGQTHLDGMVWPSVFVAFARGREWSLPDDFSGLYGVSGLKPPAPELAAGKKPGRKQGTHKENLKSILDALDAWAGECGIDFDRTAMPGPLGKDADEEGSFHWLCAKLYPDDFRKTKRTFEEHRAGVCATKGYTSPTDFYRRALPHIAHKLGKC